jgi:hypothetical protein
MKAQYLLAGMALVAASTSAAAKRVDVASSAASSTFPMENNVSYDAERTNDGKLSTAWVEGEEGSGLGSWLELDLGGEHQVHKLKIWGGMWYSREYWQRSNRPRDVELRWSDGTSEVITLADEMKAQEFSFAKRTSSVRLRIKSVYPGTTWLDTPISEVQVFDGQPQDGAVVRSVTASTELAPDADGTYEPFNVSDGLSDSMWCEGSEEGDGTAEWLEFRFAGQQRVNTLRLINGIGTGLPYWMKGNRAAAATLAFSDGSTERVTIRNTLLPQEVTFPAHLTSSVKVTFDEVVLGKEYNDLCLSEAHFE